MSARRSEPPPATKEAQSCSEATIAAIPSSVFISAFRHASAASILYASSSERSSKRQSAPTHAAKASTAPACRKARTHSIPHDLRWTESVFSPSYGASSRSISTDAAGLSFSFCAASCAWCWAYIASISRFLSSGILSIASCFAFGMPSCWSSPGKRRSTSSSPSESATSSSCTDFFGAADGDVTDTFRPSPSPDDAAFDIRENGFHDFDSCRDRGVVPPLLDASDVFRSASPGSGAVDACRARAWPPRRMRSTHAAHAASVGAQYTFLACDVSIVK